MKHGNKKLCSLLFIACGFFVTSSGADEEQYDECILTHMKQDSIDTVAQSFEKACHELHRQPGILLSKKRDYYECLLEHLPGIESAYAAARIDAACGRKYNFLR